MRRTLIFLAAGAVTAAGVPAAGADHRPDHGTPRNVTLAAAPNPVKFGRSVTLSGRLTGQNNSGRAVTIEHDPFPVGSFEDAGTATTNAAGDWSFTHEPAANTRYRARSGGADSQPVDVMVRPALRLRVSDRTPRAGRRVRFFGRMCPEHDGMTVALQRRAGRSWRTLRRIRLRHVADASCSSFSRRVRVRRDGRFRIRFGGDADHAAARSRVQRLDAHA